VFAEEEAVVREGREKQDQGYQAQLKGKGLRLILTKHVSPDSSPGHIGHISDGGEGASVGGYAH
jgi:hypothetical protein